MVHALHRTVIHALHVSMAHFAVVHLAMVHRAGFALALSMPHLAVINRGRLFLLFAHPHLAVIHRRHRFGRSSIHLHGTVPHFRMIHARVIHFFSGEAGRYAQHAD